MMKRYSYSTMPFPSCVLGMEATLMEYTSSKTVKRDSYSEIWWSLVRNRSHSKLWFKIILWFKILDLSRIAPGFLTISINICQSRFSTKPTFFEAPCICHPGYHHANADVLRIPKMWYFLGVRLFKGELLALKVKSYFIFFRHSKKSKKKVTATILSFQSRRWIRAEKSGFPKRWFNDRSENSKLWPCLFFATPLIFANGPKISKSVDFEQQ